MKNRITTLRVVAITLLTLILSTTYVSAKTDTKPKPLTNKQQQWFDSQVWSEGDPSTPDTGIDATTFVHHYEKHTERWQKVFKYISDNDLTLLPLGKFNLGDNVVVNVQEYTTREPGDEKLEGHKKYIDVQYVVSGCELHGYAKIGTAMQTVNPYDAGRDVGHYKVPVITYHVVRPCQFTIFFPDDIHITNIQYGEKASVRKVVFKVEVD